MTSPSPIPGKLARGFTCLKNVTIGGVIVDSANAVTLLDNSKGKYYVIEAILSEHGQPMLKCTKRSVSKRKGTPTKPTINKFA